MPVFRAVDDPGLSFDLEAHDRFRQIGHSFLRKRSPDDIAGQVLPSGFFPGQDAGTTIKSPPYPNFRTPKAKNEENRGLGAEKFNNFREEDRKIQI